MTHTKNKSSASIAVKPRKKHQVFTSTSRMVSGLPMEQNSPKDLTVIAQSTPSTRPENSTASEKKSSASAEIFTTLPTENANAAIFTPPFRIPRESECATIYGDCHAADFASAQIVRCDLSEFEKEFASVAWFCHRGWFGFRCHRLVAPIFVEGFRNVITRGLTDELKTFDGCFNIRKKTSGVNEWSMHSWGIAIDLNAKENGSGKKDFLMTEAFAKCFEDVGLVWGGRWQAYPDAMHFQYALSE